MRADVDEGPDPVVWRNLRGFLAAGATLHFAGNVGAALIRLDGDVTNDGAVITPDLSTRTGAAAA